MSKLRVALVLFGDAMLCVALVMLVQIDQLIHGTLYNYGLVFNETWAQPYWLLFRVSMALIVIAILLVSVVELPYPIFEEKTEPEEKTEEEMATEVAFEDEEVVEEVAVEHEVEEVAIETPVVEEVTVEPAVEEEDTPVSVEPVS